MDYAAYMFGYIAGVLLFNVVVFSKKYSTSFSSNAVVETIVTEVGEAAKMVRMNGGGAGGVPSTPANTTGDHSVMLPAPSLALTR